jgi:hypothetical protein
MRLPALDIPDDPTALPGWLERHLVGRELATLVAELSAVHGPKFSGNITLEEWLGGRSDAVLADGLTILPGDRLRQLLLQPDLLLDLQELVLVSGGDHWERLGRRSPEIRDAVERGHTQLAAITGTRAVETALKPRRRAGRTVRWAVFFAVAASLLAAIMTWQRVPNQTPNETVQANWGWNRPGALPQKLTRAAYLNQLADAASEWRKQRPGVPLALARRIAEFRQGCSVLILSEHPPLPPDDRKWLVEKCREWAAKIDRHLADLEAGKDPGVVRDEVDATAEKLIQALHLRAKQSA